jgi:hypothetical protein
VDLPTLRPTMFSVTMLSSTVTLYCLPPTSATAKTVAGVNTRPASTGTDSELMVRLSSHTAPPPRPVMGASVCSNESLARRSCEKAAGRGRGGEACGRVGRGAARKDAARMAGQSKPNPPPAPRPLMAAAMHATA